SLDMMLDTCTLAVLAEMNSSPAMSRLLRPMATRRSTSSSRTVRPYRCRACSPGSAAGAAGSPGGGGGGAPREPFALSPHPAGAEPVGDLRRAANLRGRGGPVAVGGGRLGRSDERLPELVGVPDPFPGGDRLVP